MKQYFLVKYGTHGRLSPKVNSEEEASQTCFGLPARQCKVIPLGTNKKRAIGMTCVTYVCQNCGHVWTDSLFQCCPKCNSDFFITEWDEEGDHDE